VVSKQFTLDTALSGVTFKGESPLSNGDYVATWQTPSESVTVAAPSGSTVTLVATGPGTAEAGVTLPMPAQELKRTSADPLSPAASVVPDAVAVGFTPAQVQKLIPAATSAVRPAAASGATWRPGQIMATPCVRITGDNGHAYGRACDTQRFVQDLGHLHWIFGDEVTGSGNDPCCVNGTADLTRLDAWVSYGAHNTIFKWKPNATIHEGQCTTWTASLSYNGVGLSAQQVICSDRLDPIYTNTSTKFGSAWTGCDSAGNVEGVDSVDLVDSPSTASERVTLWTGIGWASSC
jgi:hypothetical protein